MPCGNSQNKKYSISSLLFQVVKLWAKACLCVALSGFLIICIPFLILATLPFFVAFLWAFFLFKILCFFRLCPQFKFLEVKMLMNYLSYTAAKLTGDTSLKYDHNRHHHSYELVNTHNELLAKALEDKQESVELDPSEVPCLHESDVDVDEDHHQEIKGKKRVEDRNGIGQRSMHEEGSWQILMKNPRKWREPQSFYDVLSFWKHKEKGNEL